LVLVVGNTEMVAGILPTRPSAPGFKVTGVEPPPPPQAVNKAVNINVGIRYFKRFSKERV
jgi:hypothetical protein